MKVLNLYFSTTGNTEKMAKQIEKAAKDAGHEVETIKITKNAEVDILAYDFVFVGSGVYTWLPGKPMMEFLGHTRERYGQLGEIKPSSPRRVGKKGCRVLLVRRRSHRNQRGHARGKVHGAVV